MKNSVCYGCTRRQLGCRTACEDWQEEQLAKELRYDAKRLIRLSRPEHAHQNAQHERWQKAVKHGLRSK